MRPMIRQTITHYRRQCIAEAGDAWTEKYEHLSKRLHISDLGKCPRAAYLRLRGFQPLKWSDYQIDLLHYGNLIEADNLIAMQRMFLDTLSQIVLDNGVWAGSLDFGIVAEGKKIVVEHKTTAVRNFRIRARRLPYDSHLLQVLGYVHLLRECGYGDYEARVYYEMREHWAEFVVWEGDFITWEGMIDGRYIRGDLFTTLHEEMNKLEQYWPYNMPPVLSDPFVSEYPFQCAGRARNGDMVPRCRWFDYCWEWNGDELVSLTIPQSVV